jgi:LPXTG-motif cell wall-anchored protein
MLAERPMGYADARATLTRVDGRPEGENRMLRKILLGATMLVLLFAAPAAAQYPDIVVNPGTVEVGGQATVSGQGCAPNIAVTISLTPQGGGAPIEVGSGMTDADGNFTVTFTVPAGTDPGVYIVSASCGSLVRDTTITVAPAAVTPTTPGTGTGNLPRTGTDLKPLGLIGAALLGGGGLVLLASRKRRQPGSLQA